MLWNWENLPGEPRNLANWRAEFGKICHRQQWSLKLNSKAARCQENLTTSVELLTWLILQYHTMIQT